MAVAFNILVKVTLLLLLLSSVASKSISKRSDGDTELENEVDPENVNEKKEKHNEELAPNNREEDDIIRQPEVAKPKEEVVMNTSEVPPTNHTKPAGNIGIDPTAGTDKTDIARASRTIGSLRAAETPAALIESFRNKLKTARSNLEEAARKAHKPLFHREAQEAPTLDTAPVKPEETPKPPEEEEANIKKLITSPVTDDSSSSSEEHKKPKETSKSRQNPEAAEDITHLLHVREEINKIRHMMQALREQQLRQQLGAQLPLSRNLTEEETNDLAQRIEKLKDEGKISTTTDKELQNHPPETAKLIEDIKKLKESVLSFAKQVGGPKGAVGSLEELEKQIHQQREEIENLKRLVDELQPPKQFPFNPIMIKHPLSVKSDLHQELRSLQDILNELLKKEEQKEKLQLRASLLRDAEPAKQKPDEEIGTLMKIFHSMAAEGRQSSTIHSKLEKLERDLKEIDSEHQKTRQEFLLQKLEQDVKAIKAPSTPSKAIAGHEDIHEKIRRLEEEINKKHEQQKIDPVSAKISALENKLQQMTKPQSRGLDLPGDIEKELDNLQKEIDMITLKNIEKTKNTQPMSSRQLESLFTDILNPPSDHSKHDSIHSSTGKFKGIVKPPKKIIEATKVIPVHETPQIPHKTPEVPLKPTYSHPPVFQIPFCLEKYPHPHHPYPASVPVHPPVETSEYKPPEPPKEYQYQPSKVYGKYTDTTQFNHPIKTSEGYGKYLETIEQTPMKPQSQSSGYNQYQQPIKTQSQYLETSQPIKSQSQSSYAQKQLKVEEPTKYSLPQTTDNQGYHKEPDTKTIIHQLYQPTVPKASPIQIQYRQETDEHQGYGYPEEEMQYQHYKPPCNHHADIQEEMNHLNGMIGGLDDKIDYSQEPSYDMYRSKNYKPRKKRSLDYDEDKKNMLKEIQQRLNNLRTALNNAQVEEEALNSSENEFPSDFQRSAYTPDYYQPYDVKDSYAIKIKKKQKFDNLFIKIVKFILHKLEISAPVIVESLFNGEGSDYAFDGLDGNGYSKYMRSSSDENEASYNSVENDGQNNMGGFLHNFQGFNGLLGIIPTILFKLLSNFSYFLNILKRNNFFKNFLFPGALILVVDGIMALLAWWFSSDANNNILSFQNSSNYVNRQY